MRGILGWGTYLPYRRLDRSTIAAVAGSGGGKGTRTVASFDEDTSTMGVEAARRVLRALPDVRPRSLWFSTTAPAYLDKTNATTVHAALRLERDVPAYDALGSVRSAAGALRAALGSTGPALVVTSDLRFGLPGSADEAAGGDAAAALLVGGDDDGTVVAEQIAWVSVSEEFLDRWKVPGAVSAKQWEERFGETRYAELGAEVWKLLLADAAIEAADLDHVVVAGPHDRAVATVTKKLGVEGDRVVDRLAATVGNPGAAQPALLLAAALERATPGQTIALVVLADGADAVLFRATDALGAQTSTPTVAEQAGGGGAVTYGRYLSWRGLLPVEPPRRPEPARPSASAAGRSGSWKYGFVGSEDAGGRVSLPPSPHDTAARAMSEARGTIATFTVDKLVYSQSPPVVFAVVDFEGGGRLPVELTDVDAAEVAIGAPVEMTFRKLFTADGIANYFWKARLVREERG